MDTEFSEFIKSVKNVTGPRVHKVTGSYGIRDALTFYRQHRPKEHKFVISPEEYYVLIRRIHELLGEELLSGTSIKLPERMGSLYVQKHITEPRLDINGKLIYHAPIDWDETLKLWYESPEDYENKTILKATGRNYYKFVYNKKVTVFKNNNAVQFTPGRTLKQKLKTVLRVRNFEGYISKT